MVIFRSMIFIGYKGPNSHSPALLVDFTVYSIIVVVRKERTGAMYVVNLVTCNGSVLQKLPLRQKKIWLSVLWLWHPGVLNLRLVVPDRLQLALIANFVVRVIIVSVK